MKQLEARIGKTKILVQNYEQDDNFCKLHSVISRQKVNNIEVDCRYFESKGVAEDKKINLMATITKYTADGNYIFELFATTVNPDRYNHICRVVGGDSFTILKNTRSFDMFNDCMNVIDNKFDSYTRDFVSYVKHLAVTKDRLAEVPEFIKQTIKDVKEINIKNINSIK